MSEFDAQGRPVVLLVDDQPIVAAAVQRMLAGEARLEYCQDPALAVGRALEVRPTVILLDLMMPDLDGMTLVRFFRAHPDLAQRPVIVLSSREDPVDKARAFEGGANDYLVKLPHPVELLARIRYHSHAYLSQCQRDETFRALKKVLDIPTEVAFDANFPQAFQVATPAWAYLEPKGGFRRVSRRLAEMLGYSPQELVGRSRSALMHLADLEHDQDCFLALSNGDISSYTLEQRVKHHDGSWIWVELTVSLGHDEPGGGKPEGAVAVYTDISQRVKTQTELRSQIDERGRALESAHVGTWSWDLSPSGEDSGDAPARMAWDSFLPTLLGMRAGTPLDLEEIKACIHPSELQRITQELNRVIAGSFFEGSDQYDSECKVVWPDGNARILAFRGDLVRDGEGRPLRMTGAVWDVTDRKRAQLRVSVRQTVSCVLNESASLRDAAPAVLETVARAVGCDSGVLWCVEPSSRRLRCEGMWSGELDPQLEEQTLSLSLAPGEDYLGAVLKDQQLRWIPDLVRSCAVYSDVETPMPHSCPNPGRAQLLVDLGVRSCVACPIVSQEVVYGVLELLAKEGCSLDGEGLLLVRELAGVMAHHLERKHLEERFLQGQKMEAVGRLAGGIAHDFNNLLTAITGYTSLILDSLESESPIRPEVQEILKASLRASSLTGQLLAFSRRQVLQPRLVSPHDLLLGMASMLERILGEDIHLVLRSDLRVGSVLVDPGQLEQVIMNLAVNSRDSMPSGGTLTVQAANLHVDSTQERDMEPGPYVLISVTDSGCGIPPELQGHIFEPFFTTKGSQGTGLGLSTVYGIVRQSGGHLQLSSQVGEGTTVQIWLPRISGQAEPLSAPTQAEDRRERSQGASILLVEDDDGLRRLAARVLSKSGYAVLEASTGDQALALSSSRGEQIDLLLTDVIMPGLRGPEVARRFLRQRPGSLVLFMSGYTDDFTGATNVNFLHKPFSPAQLLTTVRAVLEGRGAAPKPQDGD